MNYVFAEVEQATDFLNTAGLSNLSKLYHEGKEISEVLVSDSVRQRHLTEKQAQTIRSRVRTLNNTLRGRQPRRKRQDVRDVAWNVEVINTLMLDSQAIANVSFSGDVNLLLIFKENVTFFGLIA